MRLAFLLFISLIPFTPRYLAIGIGSDGLALTLKRIMVIALSFGLLLLVAHKPKNISIIFSRIKINRVFFVLIFSLYLIKFIATVANGTGGSLIYWGDEVLLATVVVLCGLLFIRSYGDVIKIVSIILLSMLVSECLSIIEYGMGHPLLSVLFADQISVDMAGKDPLAGRIRGEHYRAMAGFGNPLLLSEFISITVFLGIAFWGKVKPWLSIASIALAPVALWATGTRSGVLVPIMAGLVAVLFYTTLVTPKYYRGIFHLLLIVLFFGLVCLGVKTVLEPNLWVDWLGGGDAAERSALERAAQFFAVGELVTHSPYIGYGMMQNYAENIDDLNHLDNYYLRLLIESGLVGVLIFITALLYLISKIHTLAKIVCFDKRLSLGLMGAAASFMLYKNFLSMPYNNVYFFLMFFIVISLQVHRSTGNSSEL